MKWLIINRSEAMANYSNAIMKVKYNSEEKMK